MVTPIKVLGTVGRSKLNRQKALPKAEFERRQMEAPPQGLVLIRTCSPSRDARDTHSITLSL